MKGNKLEKELYKYLSHNFMEHERKGIRGMSEGGCNQEKNRFIALKGVESMSSEKTKRRWVWAYIYVKIAELVVFAVSIMGSGIISYYAMDPRPFDFFILILSWLALAWEAVYCIYRVFVLYKGERFRIPMTLLIIPSLPGWYSLFRILTGIAIPAMEEFNTRAWVLPYFMPMIAILMLLYDIHFITREDDAKIDAENREKKKET